MSDVPRRAKYRLGERYPIRVAVILHLTAATRVPATTCDVSISGMLVDTPPAHFSANSVIGVELTLPGVDAPRIYRWQALVVRKTQSGLGMVFDRVRPPAIAALIRKLESSPDFPGLVLSAPDGAKAK
jgi:hypothetical protein